MKKTDIALIVTGLVLVVVAWGGFQDSQRELVEAKASYVQTVCDKAHRELSGASEQECGDAQDKANAEYLCDGVSPSARCWVEVK